MQLFIYKVLREMVGFVRVESWNWMCGGSYSELLLCSITVVDSRRKNFRKFLNIINIVIFLSFFDYWIILLAIYKILCKFRRQEKFKIIILL